LKTFFAFLRHLFSASTVVTHTLKSAQDAGKLADALDAIKEAHDDAQETKAAAVTTLNVITKEIHSSEAVIDKARALLGTTSGTPIKA
jgi:alkylhydroperoxidase family enzyme